MHNEKRLMPPLLLPLSRLPLIKQSYSVTQLTYFAITLPYLVTMLPFTKSPLTKQSYSVTQSTSFVKTLPYLEVHLSVSFEMSTLHYVMGVDYQDNIYLGGK